jgi:hypothetical protein
MDVDDPQLVIQSTNTCYHSDLTPTYGLFLPTPTHSPLL